MTARRQARTTASLLAALLTAIAACGGDGPSNPAGVPASLAAASPATIDASAAATIPAGVSVAVRDRDGAPVPGIAVSFTTTAGNGDVERPTARTDANGMASSGAWTLGKAAGTQRVVARVERLGAVEFIATVEPSAPSSIVALNLATASGTVGAPLPTPPSIVVRDRYSNPVPGVPVIFAVRSGGGTATGTETVTDAQGRAAVGRFTLGTRSGPQQIAVQVEGLAETVLTINALAGPAEVVRLVAGSDQITQVGGQLEFAPTITVRDAYENPVAGRRVNARVTQGGGLLPGELVTDNNGKVDLGRWMMGFSEGLNAVELEVDGLAPLTVYAKAVPPTRFDIQFRYLSPVTASQRAAFDRAAARWKKVIIGDIVDISAVRSSFCGLQGTSLNEVIDDLLIFIAIDSIDGPGKVLGSAGPCSIRLVNGIPHVGAMRFDRDDVEQMERENRFGDVVLHEIGHILGMGTMWSYHDLLAGADGDDPHYLGESGRAGFISAGGALYTGTHVPVENTGGPGTRDSHWRESILNAEVMTGFIEQPGIRMPLSLMTIGALEDMGYQVTIWGDDAYSYSGAPLLSGAVPRRPSAPDRELIEVPFPPPEVMSATGQTAPISARIARPPTRQRSVTRAGLRPVQQLEVRRQR